MVDTFLVPIIDKLIEFIAEEVKSLKGVHREVESLKNELEIIQPLLIDAEAKSEKGGTSDAVKAWMKQIRVQADLIEGIIDEHRYHLRKIQHEKVFTSYVQKTRQFIKSLKTRHEFALRIESIKKSLGEIKARGQGYGLRPLDQSSPSRVITIGRGREEHVDPRLESLFLEEDELVGFDSTKNELVAKLVNGPSECLVISLVGEGGIGKTTLAKKVFDDGVVKRHFESASAWITVSQPYNLKSVLWTMKEKMCTEGERVAGEMDAIEDLIGCLRNYLQTKRYAIVFDDVWKERFWDDVKLALPSNSQGSRIIITTRNGSVANYCKRSPRDLIQYLKPWSQTLALELFCKKAFWYEFQGTCPNELLELSKEIVSKCQGVPLVIAAIAGLLATKEKVVFEWQRVLNDLSFKDETNSELNRVQKIISLSYYDLPYSLRLCLMYFCVFPEDYSISDERLYRLWIAEGFVKAKGNKTSEEVAEEYMSELIKRNLVLLDQWVLIGEGNYFKVHDLMRDVIVSKAEELCFRRTWDTKYLKFRGSSRRLTINDRAKIALENVDSSRFRSLFVSNNTYEDQLTESFTVTLFGKFKLLEVLDVESSLMGSLPKELGNMFCLKYLSLRKTNVESLPKSIGKLQNLYSLDIRDTLINELPKEINKLKNLQHILAYSYNKNPKTSIDYVNGVRLQEGFGELQELQTLTALEANVGGDVLIRELEKLERLRWLGVEKLATELGNALCSTIGKLNCLQRLSLSSVDENNVLDVQHISSPPLYLRDLVLAGWLERLPKWILSLKNLSALSLVSSKLIDEESIKSLKNLQNLETLQLGPNAYKGEELRFEEGGFAKLKRLFLFELDNLKVIKIDRGALTILEHLQIYRCPLLKESPSVQHLKNIKYAKANGKHMDD